MPIAVVRINDRDRPSIVCDYCGEVIDDARHGNYQWVMSNKSNDPLPRTMHFTHKKCCHAFEKSRQVPEGMMWAAMDLTSLVPYLMTNLSMDLKAVGDRHELHRSLP